MKISKHPEPDTAQQIRNRLQVYYQLTKPGIVYGNALTIIAGFAYAAHGSLPAVRFVAAVSGSSLIIAAACVINNYIDRERDKAMTRTSKRALASGKVSVRSALVYATVLGIAGFGLLLSEVNSLTAVVGFIGAIDYLVLYSWFKRRTTYGTLVGSISGAMPIVAGYTAVTNHLDLQAATLCIIMIIWQMPHFYAIAMFRAKDYASAKMPVLPLVKGNTYTKRSIIGYIIAYVIATGALTLFGDANYLYLLLAAGSGLWWLASSLITYRTTTSDEVWARKTFLRSLITLLLLCLGLTISHLFSH